MIDLHNHILPAVDDGPKIEQDSLALAKNAIEQGISTIVASPHHKNNKYDNKKLEIVKHVEILNALFTENNLPLTVLVGQEVRLYGDILIDMEKGDIATVNGSKYLLIELPFDEVPYYTERLLYDIQMEGYVPIIVHPERNVELREDPRKLYNLVRKGAITQITAGSLLGYFGKDIEKNAHQLIESNLTHVIASDAHHATKRPFQLREALDIVKNQYGVEMYSMMIENSHLIIDDMHVNRLEPMPVKKKRKWFFRT